MEKKGEEMNEREPMTTQGYINMRAIGTVRIDQKYRPALGGRISEAPDDKKWLAEVEFKVIGFSWFTGRASDGSSGHGVLDLHVTCRKDAMEPAGQDPELYDFLASKSDVSREGSLSGSGKGACLPGREPDFRERSLISKFLACLSG